MFKKTIRNCTLAALTALLALTLLPSVSAETISVRLNEPFEIDGQVYPAGRLTVREVSDYSPVATLNEVCVGRECLGVFLARELQGTAAARQNELIFGRAADGHLVLEAVAMTGGPTRGLYGFESDSAEWVSVRRPVATGTLSAQAR